MEEYMNQVKNICSQTLNNDRSDYDDENVLLHAILYSIMDPNHFLKYNLDNPASPHWKIFTVIEVFAKTNNACLIPNKERKDMKAWTFWCLNRIMALALIAEGHKLSPTLARTCAAIVRFIERHDAEVAMEFVEFLTDTLASVVRHMRRAGEHLTILSPSFGDGTELLRIKPLGNVALKFQPLKIETQLHVWNIGGFLCELVSKLSALILGNSESQMDTLVKDIKTFAIDGNAFAKMTALEALNGLLCKFGSCALRPAVLSDLTVLAEALLSDVRDGRFAAQNEKDRRRFEAALSDFLGALLRVEGMQLSVIAQQFLCAFLTRFDAEFEGAEVVNGLLKSVRPMTGRLFDSLLAQLKASETEERLAVCRQLLFKELRSSPERKVAQFLASWADLLPDPPDGGGRGLGLAGACRCFALTWAGLLRQRTSLRTPGQLFAALQAWTRRCLAEVEAQEGAEGDRREFSALLEAIQGVGAVAHSVDHSNSESTDYDFFVSIFLSPFLELSGFRHLPRSYGGINLTSLGERIEDEKLSAHCLMGLLLIAERMDTQLICLAFKTALEEEAYRGETIRLLPNLGVALGSDNFQQWTDLLRMAVGAVKASPALFLDSVPALQVFPCLLAGSLRPAPASECSPQLRQLLRCGSCDADADGGGCEAFHLELLGGLTEVIFEPRTDEQLVISGLGVFQRMLRHVTIATAVGPVIACCVQSLPLLCHSSFRVRIHFSEVVLDLYRAMAINPKCQKLWDALLNALEEIFEQEQGSVLDTAVVTACNIGKIAGEEHFVQLAPCVLLAGSSRRHGLRGLLWSGVVSMMQDRKLNLQQLLSICRSNIAKAIVKFLYRKSDEPNVSVDGCLSSISVYLGMTKCDFFQAIFHELFFEFVMRCDQRAHDFIREMINSASWLEHTGYPDRLTESRVLPETFVSLFLRCSDSNRSLHPYFAFLAEHCQTNVERIATFNDVTRLIHQLLLRLDGSNNAGIIRGLRWVFSDVLKTAPVDPKPPGTPTPSSVSYSQLMDLLQDYFYGALVKMDHVLLHPELPIKEKLRVLVSFSDALKRFDSKAVTDNRMKILGTLKISMTLGDASYTEEIAKAWCNFLQAVEKQALCSMMTEIVACLLNLHPRSPERVTELLTFLIIDNRESLRSVFPELHFFPRDIPELQACRACLDEELYEQGSVLSAQLTSYLPGLASENMDIRLCTLRNLFSTLCAHVSSVTIELLIEINCTTVRPLVAKLLGLLLQGCQRDSSSCSEMRLLYARCLGAIGPLDPGRLAEELIADSAEQPREREEPLAAEDCFFPFEVLSQLCRVHMCSESPKQQEATAVSIQELLKAFNVDKDTIENASTLDLEPDRTMEVDSLNRSPQSPRQVQGRDLWALFDEPLHEIILPLLSAKYAISAYTDWTKVSRPLFLRPRLDSHCRWVQMWAASMNQFVSNRTNGVFLHCEPVTKTDESFAQFILPYAFLQVLLEGNEEHIEMLRVEIFSIFNLVRASRQSPGHQARFTRRYPWYRLACQTIFSVLDHCRRWMTRQRQSFAAKFKPEYMDDTSHTVDSALEDSDPLYCRVLAFIASVPHDLQAVAALGSGCLTRSLQHYELAYLALEEEEAGMDEKEAVAEGLIAAYESLRELDGVEGVRRTLLAKDREQSLAMQRSDRTEARAVLQLLAAQDEEAPSSALAEQLLELDVRDPARLANLPASLERLVEQQPTWNGPLNRFRVHAAWKLCQWDQLDEALEQAQSSCRTDWNVGIGHVLGALQKKHPAKFEAKIADEFLHQLDPICASAMQCVSYERVYDNVAKLGALFDIEIMASHVVKLSNRSYERMSQDHLLKVLNTRLEVSRADHTMTDHRLAIRSSIFSMVNWRTWQADTAFRRACLARSAGHLSGALTFLMEAERLCPELDRQLGLEHCRLLWDEGKKDQALTALEIISKEILEDNEDTITPVAGQALLFYAYCCDLSGRSAYNETKTKYEQSLAFLASSEEANFRLAHYADRTLDQLPSDKKRERLELLCFALRHYGEALSQGSEFADQSMPRMLTRWLDCGDSSTSGRASSSSGLMEVQKTMRANMVKIPAFQFYFCFTQLTSAVVHENAEVLMLLIELIVRVATAFPQQCMWWLMALHESKIPARRDASKVIFEKLKANNRHMVPYIQDLQSLSGYLKEVASLFVKMSTKHLPKSFLLTNHVKALLRLVDRPNFSHILIPLQRLMSVSMPCGTTASEIAPNLRTHNAFPHQMVHLRGIKDRVEVLHSLTRPKKVVWKVSDGKEYIMVAKPDDDLRKDSRIMRLNENINRWIRLNAETRATIQSSMIRCFAVIPLGENGGIIEWVSNTDGFRNIVLQLYKERNISVDWNHMQAIGPQLSDSKAERKRKFLDLIFPSFKDPVFPLWFLRSFPNTNAWFQARSRYIRSAAVMSMVGYLIGLGDRHGENILFDCKNGEVVHVDFNCIFNKGRCYKWPELVPFRLTHNLLAAFGPTGYEGQFRSCCEAVMRLMRQRADSMLAVFRPVVLEMMLESPVEWFPVERRHDAAQRRKYANTKLGDVENRLHGRMTDEAAVNQLPMSEEGQVEVLLKQATDPELLSQMFIGWAPFL